MLGAGRHLCNYEPGPAGNRGGDVTGKSKALARVVKRETIRDSHWIALRGKLLMPKHNVRKRRRQNRAGFRTLWPLAAYCGIVVVRVAPEPRAFRHASPNVESVERADWHAMWRQETVAGRTI